MIPIHGVEIQWIVMTICCIAYTYFYLKTWWKSSKYCPKSKRKPFSRNNKISYGAAVVIAWIVDVFAINNYFNFTNSEIVDDLLLPFLIAAYVTAVLFLRVLTKDSKDPKVINAWRFFRVSVVIIIICVIIIVLCKVLPE